MKKIASIFAIAIVILILSGLNVFAKTADTGVESTVASTSADKTAIPAGNAITAALTGTAAEAAIATTVSAAANKAQYELEDVVITGTKTKLKIKDSPAAVSVVDQEKIDRKTAVYSDDLVTGLPGVQVARTEKGDQSTVVTLRGVPGYDKNLILLDGLSIQNPVNGRVFWNRVPLDLVERVEVVRGPFSSLYGKYALGGVINIITKEPEGRSLNVTNNYDSTGIRNIAVNFRDKPNDKLAYYLAFEEQKVDGYTYNQYIEKSALTYTAGTKVTGYKTTTDATGKTQYIIGEVAKPNLENYVYSGKLYYSPAEGHTLSLLANYAYWDQITRDSLLGKTYLKEASGNLISSGIVQLDGTGKSVSVKQTDYYTTPGSNYFYFVGLNYKGKLNEILNLLGHVEYTVGSNVLSDGTLASNATALTGAATKGGQTRGVEKKAGLQTELALGQHHVILGVDYVTDPIYTSDAEHPFWRDLDNYTEPYNRYGSITDIYSAFAQDEWKILQPLTAFLGLRYDDWNSKNGYVYDESLSQYIYYPDRKADVVSPKISIVYRPLEEVSIRTSVGTAFNPPTGSELYTYSLTSTNESIANPDLKPEKDTAWEFGGEVTLPTKTTVSGTYFENYLTDLIYSNVTYGSGGFTTTQYVNAGKATIKGVETEIKHPIFTFLEASVNYTFIDGRIIENTAYPTSVGKLIPNIAQHTANFELNFKWENFSTSFTEEYQSKIYRTNDNSDTVSGVQGSYDAFATSNIKFIYSFNNVKLSAGIDNIGGLQYYTIYKTPGITYNVGLKYSWL
jgi:iron complex outermembrane receptor protein